MTRRSTAAPILAALAIVAVPLAAYVAGYLWLSDMLEVHHSGAGEPTGTSTIQRTYGSAWQASVFQPGGRIESLVRRVDVEILYSEVPGAASDW